MAHLSAILFQDASRLGTDELRRAVGDYARTMLRSSRHRAVIEFVDGGQVLDIGCGVGVFASAIAPRADRVLAIDMRPEAIALARCFFSAPNVEYRESTFEALELPEASMDGVLFLETIEHVEHPVQVLNSFRRILRPGGTLVISTPNAMSQHELLRQAARLWPSGRTDAGLRRLFAQIDREVRGQGAEEDHLYSWTWETLYRLASRCGFSYVEHRRVGFWPPSLPLGRTRLRPFAHRELPWLKALVGPFCQTLLIKLRAGA